MTQFIDQYGNNITVILGILVFVITVIVQSDKISERLRKVVEHLDIVPLLLFKLAAIAVSGMIAGSVYWIIIDFLAFDDFSQVGPDIVSGAVWGIPLAIIGSRARNTEAALFLSILTGIILLLLLTPARIFPFQDIMKIHALLLLWLATSIGIASGYAGYRTRHFLDAISSKPQ